MWFVGHTHIQNAATHLCLDSNAAGQVYTNPCQRTNQYQSWDKQGGDGPLGVFDNIFYNDATARCLDNIYNVVSTASGYQCDGLEADQLWHFYF